MTRPHRVPDYADSWLSWDTCQIAMDQAKYLVEEGRFTDYDAAFRDACEDEELYDDEYDDLCECLTGFMHEVADGNRYWRAYVDGFGWRRQDGYKDFKADSGRQLLRQVLPNADCTFYIWLSKDKRQIIIDNSHHDRPTGGEMYYIGVEPEEEDND